MEFFMIGLFIVMPILMIGLANWSDKVVTQGSEAK
ncbi:signal peptide protein [Oceanobacillus caeni]